jgi:hypothetical protein
VANVKVKALKPLGVKDGKLTVSKDPGVEFDMDEKDALKAQKEGFLEIINVEKSAVIPDDSGTSKPVLSDPPKESDLGSGKSGIEGGSIGDGGDGNKESADKPKRKSSKNN